MKAVVLAAGKGVRMLPLTEDRPKVLIEIGGKPFLYYVLEGLKKAGLTEIGIIVSYKKEKIAEFVKTIKGMKITLIEQKEISGTGNAVLCSKEFVGNDNFVLVMGDNLYSAEDIRALANKKDNFCYIASYKSEHPKDYGVLKIKGDVMIRVDEKPEKPASNLVNTGVYKFTPEIFAELAKLKKSPRGEYELTDAMNELAKKGKMKVYVLNDYWIDMSTKEKLPIVEKEVLRVI